MKMVTPAKGTLELSEEKNPRLFRLVRLAACACPRYACAASAFIPDRRRRAQRLKLRPRLTDSLGGQTSGRFCVWLRLHGLLLMTH